jgi:GMP synthase (glutamine-hydrolysing)
LNSKSGVLVVDFGAQYAQLIARRVREAKVYSEIVPSHITAAEVSAKNPAAIVLSGGPSSVYSEGAPKFDSAILQLGIPVFGICYGFQVMAAALGGVVSQTGKSEFGRTEIKAETSSKIFKSLLASQSVWMSHGDAVTQAPAGFTICAVTSDTPIAAFEDASGQIAGVQFHPEVLHSEHGQEILKNWLINIAGCKPEWTTGNIAENEIAKAKELIGSKRVICGLRWCGFSGCGGNYSARSRCAINLRICRSRFIAQR